MKAFVNSNGVVLAVGVNPALFPNCVEVEISEQDKILIESLKLPKYVNEAFIEGYAEVLEVPAEVHNYKLRLALIHFGILPSSIDAAIESIVDPAAKERLYSLWNFAPMLERTNQDLINMAADFNISPEMLDQLFIYAK